jgi:cytochrome c oxidase subunit 4
MAHRTISTRTYVIVCGLLILFTLLTVGVSFIPLPGAWRLAVGVLIAACKASLVLLFFMHLLISNRQTWLVVAVAVFWVGILFVLTLGDYFTRDLVLFTPGH